MIEFKKTFTLTHECIKCGDPKPINAFNNKKVGVCNVCADRSKKRRQDFIDRKNRVIFDSEIRKANSEYEWLSERDLRA